jgi:uncharacterized protein (DUF305 family)
MTRTALPRRLARVLPLAVAPLAFATGCASGSGGAELPPLLGYQTTSYDRPGASEPDLRFMRGMIPHHAQAVVMGDLALERAEAREVRVMAERMAVAQADEIRLMEQWLEEVGADAPAPEGCMPSHGDHTGHGDMATGMAMPGMLTPEELAELAAARGRAFDRLFLVRMIEHHEGALLMVNELFASPGAAQNDFVYKFASDVYADQTTEIHHMRALLARLP